MANYTSYYGDNSYNLTGFCGRSVPDKYNAAVQKGSTYRILKAQYEEKYAKYTNATDEYKQTAEYARLGAIVSRLRGTLKQMEEYMSR